MHSYASELEKIVLESAVPELEADGYRVIIQPSPSMLPDFMRGYRPDAIALRADKKIAIEVKSKAATTETARKRLEAIFADHPEWELKIFYAPPASAMDAEFTTTPSTAGLDRTLRALSNVAEPVGPVPILLTSWSAFEAAARAIDPDALGRAQTPARLVEMLASGGYLTPSEADLARKISHLRNRAAHGDFGISVEGEELRQFVSLVREMLKPTNKRGPTMKRIRKRA